MKIVIIDYDAGNIKSIQFAIKRLGYEAILSKDPNIIRSSDKVIFPGVGEASNAMSKLKGSKLDILIPQLKQPVLGICLGMQLLCNRSDENNTTGLGIFKVNVKKFSHSVKVPHIGWNTVVKLKSNLFDNIPERAFMYMVHSYYAELCDETIAETHYEKTFSSALHFKNFYGVQFHPEKSSTVGNQLLLNFLNLKKCE